MATILKQLKYFWIYNLVIVVLLAVKYILPEDSEVALWKWTFLVYIPIVLLPFISGPMLGCFISKRQNISIFSSIKMSIAIWITTFLTMCIPNIDCFIRDGLFDAYYSIVHEAFYFPAFVLAVLFEITCLINIRHHKVT